MKTVTRTRAAIDNPMMIERSGCSPRIPSKAHAASLWIRGRGSAWLLVPAALSLAAFVWLLALHPNPAGRTYAAYGGVYVAASVVWLWIVEQRIPDRWDVIGALITIAGMLVIAFGPHEP